MHNKIAYYIMKRRSDNSYPLLKIKGSNEGKVLAEFNNPIPHYPVMADFLSGPEVFVSGRIAAVIRNFAVDGVRFVPTSIITPVGEIVNDYTCVMPCNAFEALDKEKSVYTFSDNCYTVSKIALNNELLKSIPLNKRLIFSLQEAPGFTLFHRLVMNSILKLSPTGMYFQRIDEYNF